MSAIDNKEILKKANLAITQGDNEGFLAFCTDDTEWAFTGEKTLKGKEAVRNWMKTTYKEPPNFEVENLQRLLEKHLGRCPVILRYQQEDMQAYIKLGKKWFIKPSNTILTLLNEQSFIKAVEFIY